MEQAITECIREGILEDFLKKNRAEAMKVSIYEYDARKHIEMEREDSYKDGYQAGKDEGYQTGRDDGMKKKAKETALNLFAMGLPIEKIASAVQVNMEEVQEWITENTKPKTCSHYQSRKTYPLPFLIPSRIFSVKSGLIYVTIS